MLHNRGTLALILTHVKLITRTVAFFCIACAANIAATPVLAETLAVPCFNGGGSGGWMYNNLPDHYFPVGLIAVNEYPIRNVKNHPFYNPNHPWEKYATCVIVPAKYP